MALSIDTVVGQVNHFTIEQNQLKWEKIYEVSDTAFSFLDFNIKIQEPVIVGGKISGQVQSISDWKALGFKELSLPMYIPRSNVRADAVVSIKGNRYRVTLTNITLVQIYDDPITKQGQETPLAEFSVKSNGEFKTQFLKVPLEVYENTFSRWFEISTPDEDW